MVLNIELIYIFSIYTMLKQALEKKFKKYKIYEIVEISKYDKVIKICNSNKNIIAFIKRCESNEDFFKCFEYFERVKNDRLPNNRIEFIFYNLDNYIWFSIDDSEKFKTRILKSISKRLLKKSKCEICDFEEGDEKKTLFYHCKCTSAYCINCIEKLRIENDNNSLTSPCLNCNKKFIFEKHFR